MFLSLACSLPSLACRDEVTVSKALLRLQHLAREAPSASGRNPATHLVNYAQHAVVRRMRKLADPRMRALSSVSALESLWVGSRANHPGSQRAPVRRRRGDVHSDLTAVVIRLHWPGIHTMSIFHNVQQNFNTLMINADLFVDGRGCWICMQLG